MILPDTLIFGYIDPGTGFVVAAGGGLILAFLAGVFTSILLFFKRMLKFFKKHGKFFIILFALFTAAGALIYVTMNRANLKAEKRIVILGMDALSPRVMEPLMAAGRLPNFSKLKDTGAYSPLRTVTPPQSPVAWSSFATGQNPGKHGVFDFIRRDPDGYKISLGTSDLGEGKAKAVIQSPRFWQYLSERKFPSVILGCPMTFPPDKIHGKMLSGMGVPDILGTEGTFSYYTSREDGRDDDLIGGMVTYVGKSNKVSGRLTGPKLADKKGGQKNAEVPFTVEIGKGQAVVEFQKRKTVLEVGKWSGWQEVTFDLGSFRKMKGIFKFFLAETEPDFKLYIGPINLDPREPYFTIAHPEGYSEELAERTGLFYTRGMPFDTWGLNEKRLDEKAFLQQVEEIFTEKQEMLHSELSRTDRGLFYFYFGSPDLIQHMFWRYTDPQHPLYEKDAPEQYKEMINTWYERMDRVLGRVLEQLDKDDTIMVLSDHGFGTFRRAVHINSWLRDNGFLVLDDQEEGIGGPLLSNVDWSGTKAYAVGFGSIYINLKGRESEGIVPPGQEAENIKERIRGGLEQWIDSKYNEKVVNKVYDKEEVFRGGLAGQAPDLIVGFNNGYRASWQTAIGEAPLNLIEDNLKKWSGSHLFDAVLVDGVIFSNREIKSRQPAIIDIAPTVLKVAGFTDEELEEFDFDGVPLFEVP